MMLSEDSMIANLLDLGLNRYESMIYLTLIEEGESTAKTISDIAGIPYGKVYEIINSLCAKGFSQVTPSKPMKYGALHPEEVLASVKADNDNKLARIGKVISSELTPLYDVHKRNKGEGGIQLISGRAHINKKIGQIINSAESKICIINSENGLKRLVYHKETLKDAIARGVSTGVVANITANNKADAESLGFCSLRDVDQRFNIQFFSNGRESLIIDARPDDDNVVRGRDSAIWLVDNPVSGFIESLSHMGRDSSKIDCGISITKKDR